MFKQTYKYQFLQLLFPLFPRWYRYGQPFIIARRKSHDQILPAHDQSHTAYLHLETYTYAFKYFIMPPRPQPSHYRLPAKQFTLIASMQFVAPYPKD